MPDATGQKAQANDAVTNDHDSDKNSGARHPSSFRPAGNHHGDDEGHFNDGDSQGKYKRPEWFTDTMRDDLGMVDRGKNGGDQNEGFSCGKWETGPKGCVDT